MKKLQWVRAGKSQGKRAYDLRDRAAPADKELVGSLFYVTPYSYYSGNHDGSVIASGDFYTFHTYGEKGRQYSMEAADSIEQAKMAAEAIVHLNGTDLRE